MYRNVLIVSNMYPSKEFPSYGIFVKNFCDQLDEIRIKYEVSTLAKKKNKVTKIFMYGVFYTKTFFKCLFGKYDLVYIHYPSFSSKPVLLARKLRQFDIISNVHGTDVVPLKAEHKRMLGNTQKSINYSVRIVVPSEYYKQLVAEKYAIDASKVIVYPSAGVNERIFFEYDIKKKNDLKNRYSLEDDAFVIGFVSRINKAKGWDVFIDALERDEFPKDQKIKIIIVGSGEDDYELESRIKRLPPKIRSSILRYPLLEQKKLADIYNVLDVFVFPTTSASESLGLVAIEAMACGCPVIASDFAAPKYYVIDGYNGYKFEKGNDKQLASILTRYSVSSKSIRAELADGALKTAASYSRKTILDHLIDIFNN